MSFTKDKNSDNYATNKQSWEVIKEYIPTDKKIWAPFYCDGKQKEYFNEMGFDIIHEDEDFFENNKGDIVIDNPPFSKMKDICVRLKELDKPFILMAFSKVLLMKWFQALFKDHLQLIMPFTRPTFTHLTNPKKGYTPPYGVQYFCWKMNFPKDLIFLDANPPKAMPKSLEDLTCDQLKTRLRAINKPVGGRKADLIQRIRDHERLTAALFEED